jgi:hypothetical protein
MDRWIDGWVDGWMGGWWMDGWVGRWMGGWVEGWMGGWLDGQKDGRTDEEMNGYANSFMDKYVERQANRRKRIMKREWSARKRPYISMSLLITARQQSLTFQRLYVLGLVHCRKSVHLSDCVPCSHVYLRMTSAHSGLPVRLHKYSCEPPSVTRHLPADPTVC